MLATKAPWLLALCGENTSRVIFCQFSSVGNQTELPHVTVIGLNHPHMPPHPTHYKQLLLALTLKILRPLPKSLLALHWALMSEVTLTDTTLWVLCSSDLLTTSYHSCTDTHSWSGYCLHVWSEKKNLYHNISKNIWLDKFNCFCQEMTSPRTHIEIVTCRNKNKWYKADVYVFLIANRAAPLPAATRKYWVVKVSRPVHTKIS